MRPRGTPAAFKPLGPGASTVGGVLGSGGPPTAVPAFSRLPITQLAVTKHFPWAACLTCRTRNLTAALGGGAIIITMPPRKVGTWGEVMGHRVTPLPQNWWGWVASSMGKNMSLVWQPVAMGDIGFPGTSLSVVAC